MTETQTDYKDLYQSLKNEYDTLKRKTRYGLVWEDKPEHLDNCDSVPLLKKNDALSLNPNDSPMNYLLEGDNYHSLKALQHTHRGKIDVIYIDPPYNTGNTDFVYNDKYVDQEDGFRHSKWLSFMDKRLRLARELLSDDGVIFVSIDDNEQAQLKLMMDKIFGEDNVEMMIWQKVGDGDAGAGKMKMTHRFRREHEYIVTAYKNKQNTKFKKYMRKPDYKGTYKNLDNDHRGAFKAGNMSKTEAKSSPTGKNYYTVTAPDGVKTYSRQWHFDKNEFDRLNSDGRIYWGKSGNAVPQIKIFINEERPTTPTSMLTGMGSATMGGKLVNTEMDLIFSNPKPIDLIKYLIALYPNKSATVLDFFAGSGTTGHAVMELNKEDGGNRSFILCTNNEVSPEKERAYLHENNLIPKNNKTEYNKYKKEHPDDYKAFTESDAYQELGIAQAVTRERLKRVIEGYTTPKGKVVEGLPNNLTYLQTVELPKDDVYDFDRTALEDLTVHSHQLVYPENTHTTDIIRYNTSIDTIQVDTTKTPTFLVSVLDINTYNLKAHALRQRFGNDVVICSVEDYFDINHDKQEL